LPPDLDERIIDGTEPGVPSCRHGTAMVLGSVVPLGSD
jgi:hypothetical protein